MGTRKQLTGFAGILGGLAWVALGYLRRLSLDATPSIPLSHDQLGLITPAVALLLVFALRGAHKLHEGRAGRWERWSYPVVMSGQALLAATLVMDRWLRGEQEPPLALLYQIAYVLTFLGGLGLAVGFLRARVLPWWARPLPIGVGVGLIAAGITGREVIVDGASWVGLGLAVLVTPSREGAREALTLRAVREAFLSPTTLISGVLAVAVWSLEWQWLVGVFVVLLLYAHEIGHVLAAFWRGVQVKKAPVFLPGFGAFVETAPGTSAWDDAWISLGGPLFGAA